MYKVYSDFKTLFVLPFCLDSFRKPCRFTFCFRKTKSNRIPFGFMYLFLNISSGFVSNLETGWLGQGKTHTLYTF